MTNLQREVYDVINMKKDIPNSSKKLRGLLKFSLSTQGLTVSDLASMYGITGPSLFNCFYIPFPKAERIVADALNLQPWDLWPERYTDQKPNRFNTWYRRKYGEWKPKNTKKSIGVKGKNLNENECEGEAKN